MPHPLAQIWARLASILIVDHHHQLVLHIVSLMQKKEKMHVASSFDEDLHLTKIASIFFFV